MKALSGLFNKTQQEAALCAVHKFFLMNYWPQKLIHKIALHSGNLFSEKTHLLSEHFLSKLSSLIAQMMKT
jgi:hypothetical protein